MFIKLKSLANNEAYFNFDKVLSIVPRPHGGSLLYIEKSPNVVMTYEVHNRAEDIVAIANGLKSEVAI